MTSRSTIRQRLRYRFENTMARGTASVIAWLALVTFLLILLAGVILSLFKVNIGDEKSFIEGVWLSLLRTLDPGTMGGDQGWGWRIIALAVTLGGIFIVSALIGLLTTGIDAKLSEIRRGKTLVLEHGHTLILGWSQKVFTILSELSIANESESRSSVVVLADVDKVEMEEEIRDRLDMRKTKVICRSGDPSDIHDLGMVNVIGSKSVIILAPQVGQAPDAHVIKTVLALMKQDPKFETLSVVAECTERRNAQALRAATHDRVTTVVSSEVIARITAQVCRQSGLSAVYQDLLDFDGDEIYFTDEPNLTGRTFGDALFAFEKCCAIGIRRADGTIVMGPPMDTTIAAGDKIIAIAEDDSTLNWSPVEAPQPPALAPRAPQEPGGERLLIVGWNRLGLLLLGQLEQYVPDGSAVHVLFDPDGVEPRAQEIPATVGRLAVSVARGDSTDTAALNDALENGPFDHAIILCYRHGMPLEEAESRTLLSLVQLRRLMEESERYERHVSIVTELLDVRDVELASVADPDDFVVSESLTSLMLSQLSENVELAGVFDDLFQPDGPEVNLRPASDYVPVGAPLTFGHAVAAARDRGQVAIGFRKTTPNGARPKVDVVVNPSKVLDVTFNAGDQLVVLGQV